jgi:hypothetical protein
MTAGRLLAVRSKPQTTPGPPLRAVDVLRPARVRVLVRDPHRTPPDRPPTGTVPERRSAGHRRGILVGIAAAGLIGFVVFVFPQISWLDRTWQRVRTGHVWWLVLGTALEGLSIGANVVLFRAVFTSDIARIGLRAGAQITLAGDAATKLFAAACAGGVALAV